MTAEHLSPNQLEGYRARTLDSAELLAVDRHLASCDECHEKLARVLPKASGRPYELPLEEPFHLNYDQLALYVEGAAGEIDREIVESHVALCASCAEDLRDLKEFGQEFQQEEFKHEEFEPWRVTPPPTDLGLHAPRGRRRWQWPRLWIPQLTAAIVIPLFLLGITAAFLLWASSTQPLVHRVGPTASPTVNPPGNGPSPTPSPEQLAGQPSPSPREDQSKPHIALNDGEHQITLDERGRSTGMESLPPELRANVEKVLAARQFNPSPAVINLPLNLNMLRGGNEDQDNIVLLTPAGVVTENTRPTFRWRPLPGASEYVVTVLDSRFRPLESSGPLTGTEWTIQQPLERGGTYSWQIRAVVDGRTVISPKPPAPEARFKVLGRKALAEIENARRTQKDFHLAMAVLYWKYGLLDAAERELEALKHANFDSPVVSDLLRSLRLLKRP